MTNGTAVYVNLAGDVLFDDTPDADPLPGFSLVGVYDLRNGVSHIADDIATKSRTLRTITGE